MFCYEHLELAVALTVLAAIGALALVLIFAFW
jgi:hypothetical protein